MRWYAAAISLASSVLAALSIEDVRRSVSEPFRKEGGEAVFVRPGGPLNLLRGYIYHKDGLVRNKRLFSPMMRIDYTLKYENGEYRFNISNENDSTNSLHGGKKRSAYLGDYYRTLKIMYNAVNGEVNISSLRSLGLDSFLRRHLMVDISVRLLAALMLLAEGIDVPLKYRQERVAVGTEERAVEILACGRDGEKPLFEANMFRTVEGEAPGSPDAAHGEKRVVGLNKFGDPKTVIDFFRNVGGSRPSRAKPEDLAATDEPGFLIQAYVFDFLQSYGEAATLFSAVEEILEYTLGNTKTEAWGKFFTTERSEIGQDRAAYDAIQKINELSAAQKFPFTSYSRPPSNLTVNGYDRREGRIVEKGLEFSDCCDIAIYSLFCCLLYDPTAMEYRLDLLRDKGYSPSEDLVEFFTVECRKPVENTSHDLHQKWAQVVQDLNLGRERSSPASEDITVLYRKKKGNAEAEIVTGILNVMKVLARVAGFPEGKREKLKELVGKVQDDGLSWRNVKEEAEEYVIGMLQDMSNMEVGVECIEFRRSENKEVHGTVEMTYTPLPGGHPGIGHTVGLTLMPNHGEMMLAAGEFRLESEVRSALEEQKAACAVNGDPLGKIVAGSIQRFLDKADLALVPQRMIEDVKKASDDMERYEKISVLLANRELITVDDKLYMLDMFVPYLERETRKGRASTERQLNAGDPLLHLIRNIMGSVPLGDTGTRNMFVEVLRFCHGGHGRLFPRIQTSESQFPKLVFSEFTFPISVMCKYNVPNMLFRYCSEVWTVDKEENIKRIRLTRSYNRIVKIYIRNRHKEGMRAAKKVFRLAKFNLGGYYYQYLAIWFSLSAHLGFYEGLELVCDFWENPSVAYSYNFTTHLYDFINYPWEPLPGALRDELCADRSRAMGLLRIYAWFSVTDGNFDAMYDLIAGHYDKIGLKETLECVESSYNSFNNFKSWAQNSNLLRQAREYLESARKFTGKMEELILRKGELNEFARARLNDWRKHIDSQAEIISKSY